MKTRLLFIPDGQSFVLLESDMPPDRLVCAVNKGEWTPPPPYDRMPAPLEDTADATLCLRAVCLGDQVIVYAVHSGDSHINAAENSRTLSLTRRQRQILQGLAEGLTSKQIALRLGITPRTVSHHVSDIKLSLQANTRAQIVSRAAALGLIENRKPDR